MLRDDLFRLRHMLGAIEGISLVSRSLEARQDLLQQVSLIQEESQAGRLIEQDQRQHRH